MWMYTELIFWATLKKDTPPEVIEVLQNMIGEKETITKFPFAWERASYMLRCSSYYFGTNQHASLEFNDIGNQYKISTRSNLKNYDSEIENFLDWIKPYIEQWSWNRDMYAIVIYEESDEPTIYYLHD